jgi:hypothetical protein
LLIGSQPFSHFNGLTLDLREKLVIPLHLPYGLLKVMVSLVDQSLLMLPVQQMVIDVTV